MQKQFKHKKQFGQNFLQDKAILNRIIAVSDISKEDSVLEIGPGEGALTELLLENAKKVTCIEVDRDLEKILLEKYSENSSFRLIMKDVLQLDFKEEINEKVKVVANIPYYITSPIIQKLIVNREFVEDIYIMIQKEVAERITAKSSKKRSVLTLSVEYFGEAELLFYIPKEAFFPSPKVDSAFIKISIDKKNKYEKLVNEKTFFKYVKASFANKRKNIVNNLCSLGFEKNSLKVLLEKNDISPNKRAEAFSIDEFIELIQILERTSNE
ncbi:16S rRNA (adenine(1518)-N(6)/adenine(1519)-N(6))-dimethyltransferase RsmA [Haliovirga abyssi]|uniref:Ribosomal RNA small subunit methyltransferase A n=1 Tax=Haliovirga abyssi TaxID=2996794 RepID=A0AAU9DIE5_9FUSO|nr:16S rRNA (adenine(1518)-N(6)/adenine(1519)-N(6))-dimethyltransferase RsmA [Haliovirga abyssi]BDU50534.1 ribosomal RNA small subunit methyltransferase A [Haliovirga abyssi]